MKIRLLFFILLLGAFNVNVTAQNAGDLDPTFNSTDKGFGYGEGANGHVLTTAIQSDGKIIIGGKFTAYNRIPINYIARLNTDGSLDTSFSVGAGPNNYVYSIDIQSDGNIIIGGQFTNYNGTLINRIARLNTDGSLDTTFVVGTGSSGIITSTTIQPNGKIIIGGWFTSYNGTPRNRIACLNTDGSLDTSFVVGTGASSEVRTIALQVDGKIIIGGSFWNYNGTPINRIARLNTDGSLDTSFLVGIGADNNVSNITIQTDGKIIIGGDFTNYNGTPINRIARLNTDGSLDTTFVVGTGVDFSVSTTAIQLDGKIIIGGDFTSYNGTPINRITRLNTDGSLDTTFVVGTGVDFSVLTTAIQLDGKIIIGGLFTYYNGTRRVCITRLNTNGGLDISFIVGTGADYRVWTSTLQSDGKIIIGGEFTSYNGTLINRIARLHVDGSLDTSFNVGKGLNDYSVWATALQSDGKIIIGGNFTSFNGIPTNNIVRLNPDGSIDTSFVIGIGANSPIYTIKIQVDGKIIIGGDFTSYNGTPINRIARLNTDGSIDTSFNVGSGTNYHVWIATLQADGKIIIAGGFGSYNGITSAKIARLNSDGSLDTSFNIGGGANGSINTAALQSDGKIIIGGQFSSFNGITRYNIARLNPDGSLDTSFVGVFNQIVYSSVIQTDGKIVVGGDFSTYNGFPRSCIARLNLDGSLDTSFVVGVGANSRVATISLQPNGKIIIGGLFISYNGLGRNRITRVLHCTVSTGLDVQTVCDSLTWIDNVTYTSSTNTPTFTLVGGAVNGCDSLVTLNLTILNSATIDTQTACDSLTWLDNVTYTSSTNIPTFTLTNIHGCDSVVTLNLTILNSTTGVDTQVACDSLTWIDGLTYISSTNTPTFTLTNAAGCDSVVTLNLTLLTSTTGVDTQIACDSLTWIDNVTYTSSTNTPTFTLTNAAGCDSLVTLNLSILNSTTGIDTQIACDSLTWIDGLTYTSSTNTPTFNLVGGAANGCDSLVTLNLTINSLNASYTSIDNGGGNYTFTNTSTGSFTQTHWALGDGTTSTLANPTHTFNANGTYVVVLTINDSTTNNTCMDYYLDTLVVTGVVNPVPCAAGFVMYPDGNNNVTLVNSSTGNNLSYFWDFGDGDTSTMQFPSHTYATVGPFYLCLTVNDGVSCVDTYCDSIGINGVLFNKQTGFSINVIAPPVVVGVDEQGALFNDVTIYPNPTTNEFVVELTNFSPSTQINIISVEGKMVYTNSSINTNKINVDAADWSKGIYVVKITDKQSSKVMKLIKQ